MGWFLAELTVVIVFYICGSTVLHELSHCVAVWIQGGRVTAFRPYPHMEGETLVSGYIEYVGYRVDDRIVSATPLAKGIILLILWFALGFIHRPLWILAVAEICEVITWIIDYTQRVEGSDGGQYRIESEARRQI